MQGVARQQMLEGLRTRISAIEKRPALADAVLLHGNEKGAQPGEAQRLLATAPGQLHEIFADERRDAGAALGFTLGQARGFLSAERPALLFVQLMHEAQDGGLPYGAGLKSFGIDPDTLILGRMQTMVELLWAMEEAIACRVVAAVIADIGGHPKALDFTASRRLSLRAASAGTSVFVMRYGRERQASAAQLRWQVNPVLSGAVAFDAHAPGRPRWRLMLEKGRLRRGAVKAGAGWILDWTENGFELAEPHRKPARRAFTGTPVSGAQPAALGHRLSQTG